MTVESINETTFTIFCQIILWEFTVQDQYLKQIDALRIRIPP